MRKIIEQSLQNIENITSIIENIAQQTNILALNASIEAARAGEFGKGFAVVADNVRRLAEETRSNASDIGKITEEIVDKIGGSVTRLQETLQEVSAQSEEFSATSEEVAAATEEQVVSINQITSMHQELSKLGTDLTTQTARFKLN